MQKLQCEVCGGIELLKTEDGYFQCQYCGCKFTLEHIRSQLAGETVKVKATDFDIVGGVLKKYNGEDVEVVVPDNVTVIGAGAFKGLKGIKSVKLPQGLTEIEDEAFENCCLLSSVNVPDSVRRIGKSSFSGCVLLTSVNIPKDVKSIGESAFRGCTSLSSATIPYGVKSIMNYTFSDCVSLKSVSIPYGCETIGVAAFKNIGISAVTLPVSIKTINISAFDGCRSLANINIPEGVELIGARAFSGTKIDSLTAPYSLKEIGTAFEDCDRIITVTAGGNLHAIKGAMGCAKRVALTIRGTDKIPDNAFRNCYSLESLSFSGDVREIGKYAFEGCRNLQTLVLSNSIEIIGEGAFTETGITSLNIPAKVKSLEFRIKKWAPAAGFYIENQYANGAFYGCEKLNSVNFENPEIKLEEGVFGACKNLSTVTGLNMRTVNSDVFWGSKFSKALMDDRTGRGVCPYCGGAYKGIFKKECSVCYKQKK